MHIISKFNDYYDTASSFGIDKTCIYERKKKLLVEKPFKDLRRSEGPRLYDKDPGGFLHENITDLKQYIICFCGQSFSTLRVSRLGYEDQFFYSHEQFDKYLSDNKIKLDLKKKSTFGTRFEDVFEIDKFEGRLKSLFHKHKVPVFVYGDFYCSPFYDLPNIAEISDVYLNPELKYFQFYKVKDPFMAFQEIHQFISGYLGSNEVDTVDIDDENMAKQKGFYEYSFKTTPGSKKPRRKNK